MNTILLQEANTTSPTKPFFQKVLFWEIGALELSIVFSLLGSIFFILHYFNVLRLDSAFPSLQFLPHQERHAQIVVDGGLGKHSVVPVTNERVKEKLLDYVKSVVNPAYLSQKVQSLDLFYDKKNFAYELHWGKDAHGPAGNAGIELEQDKVKYMHVSLYISNAGTFDSPSTSSAQTLARQYLVLQDRSSSWLCDKTKNICQQFVSTSTDKSGYIVSLSPSPQIGTIVLVSAWSVPQESSLFATTPSY